MPIRKSPPLYPGQHFRTADIISIFLASPHTPLLELAGLGVGNPIIQPAKVFPIERKAS